MVAIIEVVGVIIIAILVVALLIILIAKFLISRRKKATKYPKDIVILHQFPRGLRAPSVSSFALKLETWYLWLYVFFYS
jgi:Ca2+/Na+ antiporter